MNILLLFGGQSHEHEVSLVSAAYILEELHKSQHTIYTVAVHKSGLWHLTDMSKQLSHANTHGALFIPQNNPLDTEYVWAVPSHGIWNNLKQPVRIDIDCAFSIIHGYSGEDGLIQGMLELANIPCAGCDAISSTVCMHKHISKLILQHCNLPTIPGLTIHEHHFTHNSAEIIDDCLQQFSFPLIIKPSDGGSSVGISTARTVDELRNSIQSAFAFTSTIIVEALLENIREIETSIISIQDTVVSFPPGEIIIPSKQIYDYNTKYHSNIAYPQIPADIPRDTLDTIQALSEKVFIALGCSGFARIDFFLTEDNIVYVNEVNTIPGFTPISMFPKVVNQKISTAEVLNHIIESGVYNHALKAHKKVL